MAATRPVLVIESNAALRLTAKKVEILNFLYRNAHWVVAHQALLNEVWGYNAGLATRTLETQPIGCVYRRSTALIIAFFRRWAA